AEADHYLHNGSYINFSTGLRMDYAGGQVGHIQQDHMPFCAPGFATVANLKSPYTPLIQKRNVTMIPDCTSITTSRPMYLKIIHDYNDRIRPTDAQVTSDTIGEDVDVYFPMLMDKVPVVIAK
ncbi:MAG: hypothetical protein AAF701_04320, partial [Pseudomonadota bacterium]